MGKMREIHFPHFSCRPKQPCPYKILRRQLHVAFQVKGLKCQNNLLFSQFSATSIVYMSGAAPVLTLSKAA
jgi:hypothetical protein